MFRLGKTRPLPGNSSIGSIKTRTRLRSGVPPRVQHERQCAGHLANTRHGAYLEYTQNKVIQHQGEDPTGKPATPYLQH
ncbi:hypothetical protein TNCV_907871 [Trichonephila clavipes]|nr:hypothetical protein TNCV_907871 [Trichonephila clavipes]